MTYTMIKEDGQHAEKTNFIPHSIPAGLFRPIGDELTKENKLSLLGEERKDHFVSLWVNRNAKRKRPNDVLLAWKQFLDRLEKEKGHKKATLIMHTEPTDQEGPNLYNVCKNLGIQENVFFSRDRIDFDQMNIIYNIVDVTISMSYAEGFGLSTLESMMTGTPIIAPKTGGLTRQVVDHRDNTENGVALDIALKSLVGSQGVPYIYEDYASVESAVNALMKLHDLSEEDRNALSKKVLDYASSEFRYENTVEAWHKSMLEAIEEFKSYRSWEKITI